MPARIQRIAVALAVLHTLMLAAYTLPGNWVPLRVRYWSQAYARVMFHQDWRLFAPDPPRCACALIVQADAASPAVPLADLHAHFVHRRMAANACRFAEGAPRSATGDTVLAPPALSISLERMCADLPRKGPLRIEMRSTCGAEGASTSIVRLSARR